MGVRMEEDSQSSQAVKQSSSQAANFENRTFQGNHDSPCLCLSLVGLLISRPKALNELLADPIGLHLRTLPFSTYVKSTGSLRSLELHS
jgi:hypothetical protein